MEILLTIRWRIYELVNVMNNLIDKVAIIIPATNDNNPYDNKLYHGKWMYHGPDYINNFYPINVPHDIIIKGETGKWGRQYQKFNEALMDYPNYKYYMLLHDDNYDFALGWLEKAIKFMQEHNDEIVVCSQDYGPNGLPTYYTHDSQIRKANVDHQLWDDRMQIYFERMNIKFDKNKWVSLAGAENVLMPNKVVRELNSRGGFPYPLTPAEYEKNVGVWERVFSAVLNCLDYQIKDVDCGGATCMCKHSTMLYERDLDKVKHLQWDHQFNNQ